MFFYGLLQGVIMEFPEAATGMPVTNTEGLAATDKG